MLPGGTSGANTVIVRRFKDLGLSAGNDGFTVGAYFSETETNRRLKLGDCATTNQMGGRWSLAGIDTGPILCFIDGPTGDANLWWGYDRGALLVTATNQRGDRKALYGFFQQVGPFIRP